MDGAQASSVDSFSRSGSMDSIQVERRDYADQFVVNFSESSMEQFWLTQHQFGHLSTTTTGSAESMADSGESDSAAELISTLSSMLPGALEYPEPLELTKEEVDLRKSNLPVLSVPARGYSDDFLANLFTPSELLAFRFSIDARLSAKELQKLSQNWIEYSAKMLCRLAEGISERSQLWSLSMKTTKADTLQNVMLLISTMDKQFR